MEEIKPLLRIEHEIEWVLLKHEAKIHYDSFIKSNPPEGRRESDKIKFDKYLENIFLKKEEFKNNRLNIRQKSEDIYNVYIKKG